MEGVNRAGREKEENRENHKNQCGRVQWLPGL
jgi:hypothetical protein